MQTPQPRASSSGASKKLSPRSIFSEASQKSSPKAASSEAPQKISPRVVRQLKTGPRYSDHTTSLTNTASRALKETSPKVEHRRSPKSPASEKKRSSKVSGLESQISQLENDLKVVKDQLCSAEALKKQARKDAEEYKQQLLALSLKLEESEKQLLHQSVSEEVVEEHHQTLQSKLEAIKKQHSDDSAALASALDEIKRLKLQLEMVAESEATRIKHSEPDKSELHKLKENLSKTLLLVEDMKKELRGCKESETQAKMVVEETLMQLETAKKMVETLRSDGLKAKEAYSAVASELDESRARVNFLEELVRNLKSAEREGESREIEVNSVKLEVEQLRSALEAAEIRYDEEQARNAEQMRKASKMVEELKSVAAEREAELDTELRKSEYEIEELRANLMDKETELQGICEENEALTVKLESSLSGQREHELENELNKSKAEIQNLKALLMDKENEWQSISDENKKLKSEMIETRSNGKVNNNIVCDIEVARAAEREALTNINYMNEEIDKSNKKGARAAEQLEAAKTANAEMEAELRRIKVQADQWRKAAEAAAAMLSAGNNGQIVERTGSMDSHYSPGKVSSPYADDLDDEDLLKKKNANKLRRFGVLWKKPQK